MRKMADLKKRINFICRQTSINVQSRLNHLNLHILQKNLSEIIMHKLPINFICFLFCCLLVSPFAAEALEGFDPEGTGSRYPESANGSITSKPSLPTHQISQGSITIDGFLNEDDWIDAPAATGFTQFEPDRHATAAEDVVFKVIYDEDAIYFGIACFRHNGTPVTSVLSRRDNITSSDRLRIYIDPYHDLTTGYHFRINPHGVKEDYYNYGDNYHDQSWDAVWTADTHIDEEGWYAEIRIPFSSVRYRAADSMTWGFNVFQYIHSLGQRVAWSNWDREQSGFMSRSGTITGINGIRPPRQLEISPYIVSSKTDPSDPFASGMSDENWDNFSNFGTDIKYGVTADLTLNATIQPDFGQVESDPSQLNLSPYETYYNEKRPFFVEGAQFFWHPDFTVFYSRRIGTGSQNSRIRAAAKLTGKVTGDVSTAVLVAATDETADHQAHNPFKSGDQKAVYAISRFGKQFNSGQHNINVMQTAVIRDKDSFSYNTRNGYTTGADFKSYFKDRKYILTGSFVGSIVDRHAYSADPDDPDSEFDPDPTYGTGSRFEFQKSSGAWRYAFTTRHQTDELDINDLGYISDPNHYAVQAWATRVHNSSHETSLVTYASLHARAYKSWIYADRSMLDQNNPGQNLWSYKRGHDLRTNFTLEGDLTMRNRWGGWFGMIYRPDNTNLYVTRYTLDGQRGPLMTDPSSIDTWFGFHSDGRRTASFNINGSFDNNSEGSHLFRIGMNGDWVQSSRINHAVGIDYTTENNNAQWLDNVENTGGGIGDVSYLFGELERRTWDLTLRSSIIFTRDRSLEVYIQPYLTTGTYTNVRQLATPDSYDLQPYANYDASQRDFSYGAVNMNMVYRWEYRPGSTIYLVWAHERDTFDSRGTHDQPENFNNNFSVDPLFKNEAQNRFMLKVSYWFPV